MMRLLMIGLVLALIGGCKKSSQNESSSSSSQLRYTVRDENGTRSSRNRESVLKTVGMSEDQIRAWAKESPADEDRKAEMYSDDRGGGGPMMTIRNERMSLSSRNRQSLPRSSSEMTDDQIRAWVEDSSAANEGRSAMLVKNAHVQIIWRGSSGELLYTVRNSLGSQTGRVRESVLATVTMNQEQIRAWVKDSATAAEGRSAILFCSGFMEGISRGPLQDPP